MSNSPTHFTRDEIDQCQNWLLPDISSENNIPATQKHSRQSPPEPQPTPLAEDEVVEPAETEVKPLTAEQLQQITEAAEQEGYQAGYEKGLTEGTATGTEQGYQEGLAQGKQAVTSACERFQHIIAALMVPLETEHRYLETLIVDMVTQLTTAVVKRELQTDSAHIVVLVDAALNKLPATVDKYALYLNSQDVALVEEHLQTLDAQPLYHIDDQLMPGGCRLESRNTVVDFSVEKRLAQVVDDFIHKRFAIDHSPESAATSDSESVADEDSQDTDL